MTGTYPPEALPRYLCPAHTNTIRDRLDRLRLVQGSLPGAGEGRFDGFNLSDIFEYMSPAEHERCYAALIDRANPGARLAYWNMLAPRGCPAGETGRVSPLTGLAASLHARDRAWFYQAFHVDEVKREASP
jgi:S-adenosylmethionine-diacylglycerol 3-amino-3-carboxypropyl transferase